MGTGIDRKANRVWVSGYGVVGVGTSRYVSRRAYGVVS